jgi:hypothetical protein
MISSRTRCSSGRVGTKLSVLPPSDQRPARPLAPEEAGASRSTGVRTTRSRGVSTTPLCAVRSFGSRALRSIRVTTLTASCPKLAVGWRQRGSRGGTWGNVRRRSVRSMRPGTQRCWLASGTRPIAFARQSWRSSAPDSPAGSPRVDCQVTTTSSFEVAIPRRAKDGAHGVPMGRRTAHPPATWPARRRRPDDGSAARGPAQARVLPAPGIPPSTWNLVPLTCGHKVQLPLGGGAQDCAIRQAELHATAGRPGIVGAPHECAHDHPVNEVRASTGH